MIGHSDFIPVGQIENSANKQAVALLKPEAYKASPARSGFEKSSFDLGNTSSLIMATENTQYGGNRIENIPRRGQNLPEVKPINDFVLSGVDGDRTTTMDFIDHMLNKGEQDNKLKQSKGAADYKKLFEGNDFKLPEYDGIQ